MSSSTRLAVPIACPPRPHSIPLHPALSPRPLSRSPSLPLSSSAPPLPSPISTPPPRSPSRSSSPLSALSHHLPPSPSSSPSLSLSCRSSSLPTTSSPLLPSCAVSGARYHHVFAIGSMTNPTSLLLRGIRPHPNCSMPGVLRGYRLVFHGPAGMANIERVEDGKEGWGRGGGDAEYASHFHGVLHLIDEAHLDVLDRIEAGYVRRVVDVELYDRTHQLAFAYQMSGRSDDVPAFPHGLPSERYLDIISRGCTHYHVDERYVRWLRSLPHIPRPDHSQLLALPLPPSPRLFTRAELAACDGEDGRELCIAVNGKVLLYVGERNERSAGSPCYPSSSAFSAYEHMAAEYGGRDVTHLLSLMCYEPLFPIAACASEMSEEHKMTIEDMYSRKLACLASFAFQVVGVMDPDEEQSGALETVEEVWVEETTEKTIVSPRSAARVVLQAGVVESFKARRRRGSLTSSILQNVQSIIAMERQASGDSGSSDDQPPSSPVTASLTNLTAVSTQTMLSSFTTVTVTSDVASQSPLSHSASVASCTATTAALSDYSPSLSSVESQTRSPLSSLARSLSCLEELDADEDGERVEAGAMEGR